MVTIHPSVAFVPSVPSKTTRHGVVTTPKTTSSSFVPAWHVGRTSTVMTARTKTALQMSTEDFNESKYTVAAWATVSALMKASEYYSTSTVEAPILLDVLLNPAKHTAGEDAESAKRVVEKILSKAGANTENLRKELEEYMGKQAKITGDASSVQKAMGRTLSKVLDTARQSKGVLGVRTPMHTRNIHEMRLINLGSFYSHG